MSPSEWQDFEGFCEAGCRDPNGRPVWHEAGTLHDHAFVRQQWPLGFTTVKRCMDMKSAVYVCKYVSKDPMARVRASIGYGKTLEGIDAATSCVTLKASPREIGDGEGTHAQ